MIMIKKLFYVLNKDKLFWFNLSKIRKIYTAYFLHNNIVVFLFEFDKTQFYLTNS